MREPVMRIRAMSAIVPAAHTVARELGMTVVTTVMRELVGTTMAPPPVSRAHAVVLRVLVMAVAMAAAVVGILLMTVVAVACELMMPVVAMPVAVPAAHAVVRELMRTAMVPVLREVMVTVPVAVRPGRRPVPGVRRSAASAAPSRGAVAPSAVAWASV